MSLSCLGALASIRSCHCVFCSRVVVAEKKEEEGPIDYPSIVQKSCQSLEGVLPYRRRFKPLTRLNERENGLRAVIHRFAKELRPSNAAAKTTKEEVTQRFKIAMELSGVSLEQKYLEREPLYVNECSKFEKEAQKIIRYGNIAAYIWTVLKNEERLSEETIGELQKQGAFNKKQVDLIQSAISKNPDFLSDIKRCEQFCQLSLENIRRFLSLAECSALKKLDYIFWTRKPSEGADFFFSSLQKGVFESNRMPLEPIAEEEESPPLISYIKLPEELKRYADGLEDGVTSPQGGNFGVFRLQIASLLANIDLQDLLRFPTLPQPVNKKLFTAVEIVAQGGICVLYFYNALRDALKAGQKIASLFENKAPIQNLRKRPDWFYLEKELLAHDALSQMPAEMVKVLYQTVVHYSEETRRSWLSSSAQLTLDQWIPPLKPLAPEASAAALGGAGAMSLGDLSSLGSLRE